ncbi:NADH-ubiquinone oxidoreductase chain J [Sporocytophaga myxococcoides]|uniref:NADH-quinone oxidoreductase subunit J n=1 Tax=Sporocytophaga myxococcoides TaxID=153721 RepID=A0A098LAN0_9BACT|nr:NADH-quinone oxidoreductase subunit J [Sporocytophaga myxococcoides]GAL83504.1 NADH-ubiquinone oxidoreductase chain J [Sporocytophaga myxococcoides]
MDQLVFLILSIISIGAALAVIFSKNPVYSVLFLILTFFSIAGHYVLLNAEFLFIVHIIVYAGAILVLFLFVIMLLNLNKTNDTDKSMLPKIAGAISGGLLLIVLLGAVKGLHQAEAAQVVNSDMGSVKNLGKILFDEYLLPFEVSSTLFLSAMIGAVMLGKKNLKDH